MMMMGKYMNKDMTSPSLYPPCNNLQSTTTIIFIYYYSCDFNFIKFRYRSG